MDSDSPLRDQIVQLLRGGQAHATFDDVVHDFPLDRIGLRPQGVPYSAWELVEHMRIAQSDILEFSRSAKHASPKWPEGYWPGSPAPEREGQWNESIQAFHRDLSEFEALVQDPAQDLNRKFPWGEGQTLLREALLIADHNAYHLGQLVLVRRLLGEWKKS